ncbi:hypothetical protein HOU03_gp222 [Caulobacter phage CcrSC]|uniref:Uncharacterized protein n=1 Tax=Caulobacter phage CcrSC TaxID=2283272 RepID=A0A385EEG1_9CAUD|nr:hypothetical protein HOU03_gp222 [Caulobacter phage CcrSC]AXQ70046.1 hypothetical protein CcrSC_gp464 [Caulobacter phage CcrSC]
MSAPAPPGDLVGNGDAVWGWADRLSRHTHDLHKSRELWQQIVQGDMFCGSCRLWMTKSCPREHNDGLSGYSRGPSSGALKCSQYQISPSAAKLLEERKAQYQEVSLRLKAGG